MQNELERERRKRAAQKKQKQAARMDPGQVVEAILAAAAPQLLSEMRETTCNEIVRMECELRQARARLKMINEVEPLVAAFAAHLSPKG